ncbi:hypothetical protein [Microbacterium elymi]|uniref:hypothetical protein n=1 Tax=Microbacterium elymi TaxID=2909587 RepID=UPI00338E1C99
MSQTATSFDPRPLTEPVDKKAARAFWRRIRSSGGITTNRIVGVAIAVVFLVFFVGVGSRVFGAFFSAGAGVGGGMGALLVVVPVVFGLAVIGVLVAVVRSMFGPGAAVRAYRLDRFARANGMSYEPGLTAPQLPGMIFGQGNARRSADLVRGQRPASSSSATTSTRPARARSRPPTTGATSRSGSTARCRTSCWMR